ncbi:hypothetical protein KHA80_20165 [Anaerobacillus sp. HL2]|nr:hypothetical protein KHA80_20165 [Anaerobacillus sp. HL2]
MKISTKTIDHIKGYFSNVKQQFVNKWAENKQRQRESSLLLHRILVRDLTNESASDLEPIIYDFSSRDAQQLMEKIKL